MKNTSLTTTTLALAALLCAVPAAGWADGRFGTHRDGRAAYSHRDDQPRPFERTGRWNRGQLALGEGMRRALDSADDNSRRRYPRLGNDRDEHSRRDRRSRREHARPSHAQPRLGYDRDDRKRRQQAPKREHSRPAPNRSMPRLGYDRDQRRDVRRDDGRRKTLPPSPIYRAVPQRHERVYREREHEREVYRRVPRNWVLDRRYRHDRYYPPRGHIVRTLPRDHRVVHYHGTPYYFWSGIWYRPSGSTFIVVSPPIGLVVPFLPLFYTTLWVHGTPYYYADGVYYTYSPANSGYVVVEAPQNGNYSQPVQPQEELYVYPMKGQSEEQQATDRYECHHWAVGQTNFDPTQPPSNLSPDDFAQRRAEYLRAMRACLEGRGYSVK